VGIISSPRQRDKNKFLINFISTLTDQKKNTTYNEKYLQYNTTVQHLSTTYLVIVTVFTFQKN